MPQSSSQVTQPTPPPIATSSLNLAANAPLIGALVLVVALSLVLTAFGYKTYCVRQRSRLLKRQIAILEAMWRISSTK